MRKIILTTSLFFCLSITTILAQVVTTNIATPNSNGLSNNQVSDFDVNTDGTILNNSASGGTAQLGGGTAVTANPNITAGSEADLILLQVTGITDSSLDGTIEVFGTEAGIIIANPNGIRCGGCGFINADRVDLVTGTYNIATGTYSISDNDVTVVSDGLFADNVGVLNIQTNNFNNNSYYPGVGVSADTFNLSLAGDFNTFVSSEIIVNTFNLSLAGDFNPGQYSEIIVNTFNFSVAGDFDDIVNYTVEHNLFLTKSEGRFRVNALNLNVDGDFTFSNSANNFTWRANDTLTVSGTANITAASFNNSGTINVTNNSFNATVDNFINQAGATISAFGNCNIVATTSSDNGTINCRDFVAEAMVIDIAAPNNGFSNNSVVSFDVNANGTILNNSAGGGTAQFRSTTVTANSNITAGSEASLILLQVTGSGGSSLNGTIEVFGTEAGLIIANPNGIACNACAFINANRVDLVTGSGYDLNTNRFGSIAATDITLEGSSLELDVLNIQTGRNFSNSATINADNLNIIAGADFSNSATIDANNLNIIAGADFSNSATIDTATVTIEVTNFADDISSDTGTISSANLNFILTDSFTHSSTSFSAFNNFSNLAITTEGTFTNNNAIDLAGNLTITANTFTNSNSVTAADNLSVVVSNHFNNSASTLKADNVDIQATGYILNSSNGMIEATDNLNIVTTTLFNVAAGAKVVNGNVGGNIIAANLTIETGAFNNINNDGDINGNITATSFNLSVAGDFDYANKGTITTNNAFNLNVGGDFSYNDSASNLDWVANDTLTVLGTANIVAADFANSGTITVSNSIFDITATDFTNTGTISADTFSLSVAGDFDYIADFLNQGTITANAFNFNVGGNFSNNDANNDFVWNANDTLTVLGTASVVADDFANSGTITITNNSLNLTANTFANTGGVLNADTFALSVVAGDFDYIADFLNQGTITTNALNLTVGGDFSNKDSASDFVWRTNDTLTVSGNASIDAASFNNSGTITVTNSSFNITATDFTNSGTISANTTLNTTVTSTVSGSFANTGGVSADTFALSVVAGDFDYIADYLGNGTITTNTLNLNVGGNFSNNDANNDFVWNANDTLTVSGNASIDAADFNNSGTINVINSFDITAAADFDNSGTINVTNIFDITAAADFTNAGNISANSFNTTVDDFINESSATITAAECNLVHTTYTDNGTITCLDSEGDTEVIDIAIPDANGLSNNSYTDFNIPSNGIVLNNSDSDGTSQLAGDISANTNYNSGDAASIILNQVTGTIISLLVGTLEVFGAEAVVIIANPNGITCNGCGFLNASRVDLATASSYNFDADSFDIIENTNIALIDNGLDASSSGILNIQAGGFTNTGVLKANIFNLFVDDFDYTKKGTINATSFNLSVDGNFSNNDANNDFVWNANDTLTVSGNADIVAAGFANSGNITANSFDITATNFTNAGTINADTFALSVAGDFDYIADFLNQGTITTNTLNLNVGGNFSNNNSASDLVWNANDTLTVLGSANIVTASFNNSGIITVTNSSLNLTATDFTNSGTISANTTLNTTVSSTASNSFSNVGTVSADTFSLSVAGNLNYANRGTITTNALNLNVDGNFSYNDASSDFTWGANDNLTVSGNADIVAASFNNSGNITVTNNSLNITANTFANTGGVLNADTFSLSVVAGDFDYIAEYLNNGTINTNALNLNVGGDFSNNDASSDFIWDTQNSLTVSGSANIVAASFNNSGIITVTNSSLNLTATDFTNNGTISANTTLNTTVSNTSSGSFNNTGGVLNADTVSLSLAGDFDDTKKGIINANYFNLTVGGSFINNNTNSDFVLAENDSLSILGDFTIATNNYIQFGTIDVDGVLNIDADRNFVNHGAITTESLNITTGYTAINSGAITTESLEITAGYTAINQGSIVSDILAINAADFFRNLTGGDISTDTLNIIAGGKVTNTANITVGTLNIIANDDSSRTNDTTGFYVSNRGNITATSLNIAAVDNFYNRGNITATTFNITRAKSVFFLNREIDSFYAAGHTYDGGDISLSGDSSFIAAGGSIENYGNIDLGVFNLDLTANSFTNHEDANVTANTVNLNVSSFVQNGFIDATINQ